MKQHVGPVEFSMLGGQVAVRCPRDLDAIMRKAGGTWEPGSRRWLLQPRRVDAVVRQLERQTDPLFRHAGLDLDQ